MRFRSAAFAALVLVAATACGTSDGQQVLRAPDDASSTTSPAEEITSFSELAQRPYTEEVTAYSGPALTFEDYKREVNAVCEDLTALATDTTPPTEEDGEEAVARWTAGLLDASTAAYRKVASLRPPADKEAEVRTGFLTPYYKQVRASERLYIEYIAVQRREGVESVIKEALDAKQERAIFAAKNDLTECMG